jgi:signal transduction histidine kinase
MVGSDADGDFPNAGAIRLRLRFFALIPPSPGYIRAMRTLNTGFVRSTLALLGAGLLILIVVAGSSVWLSERTRENAADIREAQSIRTRTSRLLILLLEAETGQRGFLLTEDPKYLDSYERAQAQIGPDVARLKELHRSDPGEVKLLDEFSRVAAGKFAELAQTIALARSGKLPEAIDAVKSDRGRDLMEAARKNLLDLLARADARLASDVQDMSSRARYLSFATIAGTALIFAFALGSFFVVLRYMRDLVRARTEVQTLNDTLEERVQERTTDLARANDEIQRFAYIVSHDLRAPLVNIMGFTSELETGVGTVDRFIDQLQIEEANTAAQDAKLAIKEDMPEAIGFIRTSSTRMDGLINAILRLSREGRRTLKPERVDVGALLDTLADNVQHQVSEAGGEIVIAKPVPMLVSDRLALEQVFGNLFDNAVKYRDRKRPLRIEVRAMEQGRAIYFEVQDNGRGIAKQDHERIFELFRRAGVQDSRGEGIGLAHVRALVRRLGGDVSVESELGAGTTFRVSLPRVLRQATEGVNS